MEVGGRWTDIPKGYAVPIGCQMRVCPLSGQAQARRRLSRFDPKWYLPTREMTASDPSYNPEHERRLIIEKMYFWM